MVYCHNNRPHGLEMDVPVPSQSSCRHRTDGCEENNTSKTTPSAPAHLVSNRWRGWRPGGQRRDALQCRAVRVGPHRHLPTQHQLLLCRGYASVDVVPACRGVSILQFLDKNRRGIGKSQSKWNRFQDGNAWLTARPAAGPHRRRGGEVKVCLRRHDRPATRPRDLGGVVRRPNFNDRA
jgi:hypothetical protein